MHSNQLLDPQITEKIVEIINKHNIVLFIKGSRDKPMCGFSNTVIQIFNQLDIQYHTVNVLEKHNLKEAVKMYSKWPTIPQVYINKNFIGGSDIILQLYKTKQLQELLEIKLNS